MTIRYRRFGRNENEIVAKIFARVYNGLLTRAGDEPFVDIEDEAAWTVDWERDRKSLFEHFSASDNDSWLAEEGGEVVGYARSILRDGVCQLTDFWVRSEKQASGVGHELLNRAFRARPEGRGRLVISTTTGAAMARYLKADLDVLCPVLEFARTASSTSLAANAVAEPMAEDAPTLEILNRIDRAVLGFEREVDHRWFLGNRAGYLYRREGEPVGYGYVGRWNGPFAALEPADLPTILAHAESQVAQRGGEMMLIVPMANSIAARHLLSRGFRMNDRFVMLCMADSPRPCLDRYIIWWPGFC